jgi:O-antigen ligase
MTDGPRAAQSLPALPSPHARPVWPLVLAAAGLLIAALPWPWLLLATLGLLPLLNPVFGLALLVLSVTAQDSIMVAGGLTLTQAAAPLALAGWGIWWLARPARRLGLGRTAALWGIFLLTLLIATALSRYSSGEGIKELWRWGAAFLAWLLAATVVRRGWHVALVLGCLVAAPLANALIGLVQFLNGDGPRAFRIVADLPFVRAYGTIGQPNSFAGYINLGWPLVLALAVGVSLQAGTLLWRSRSTGVWRPALAQALLASLLWVGLVVLLAALGASFSRGAWLGAAVGLVGMLVAAGGRPARIGVAATIAAGALLLAVGGQVLPGPIADRLASITGAIRFFDPSSVSVTPANFAVVERMAQIWAGWRMFLSSPLVGIGPGGYTLAFQEFTSAPWFASRGHAHNYYLHLAAEAGLIGLASYLALIGAVIVDLRIALRHTTAPVLRAALIGICGMIAALVGHNLFEHVHVLHLSLQSAAAWGLAMALRQTAEEHEE